MNLNNYPGAKNNTGLIQFLVNEIPYHTRYWELYAGSAALFRNKRAANSNILNDINSDVVAALKEEMHGAAIYNLPAVPLLQNGSFTREDFIYLDPPYPKKARRSGRSYYKHEMLEDYDHVQLLTTIQALEANVMISTGQNDLYDDMLKGWRKKEFNTMSQRGPYVEIIFMNYDQPTILHQYDMLGSDYIERQHMKRKITRFKNKIEQLPIHQKHLLMQLLIENDTAAVQHFLSIRPGSKV